MKENNFNCVIGWFGLLLMFLLSISVFVDNIGISVEELGLSDYCYFVIYFCFDKVLKVQKNNDEVIVICEFEYIYQQVLDNILLILYFVEVYCYFGYDDWVRLLFED